MTKPFCIVGTSMGAAVVASFTVKYPEYVKMMCLLAPPRKLSIRFEWKTNLINF